MIILAITLFCCLEKKSDGLTHDNIGQISLVRETQNAKSEIY